MEKNSSHLYIPLLQKVKKNYVKKEIIIYINMFSNYINFMVCTGIRLKQNSDTCNQYTSFYLNVVTLGRFAR